MSASSETNRNRLWPQWLLAIAFLQCLLPGCRTAQDNQIELLERELRTQEDYIYELEDYVVQYSERLRNIRCAQAIEIDSEPYDQKSIVKKSHRVEDPDTADSRQSDSEDTSVLADELPEPKTPQIEPDPVEGFDLEDFEPPPLQIEEQQGRVIIGTTDGLAVVEEDLPRSQETVDLEIPDPAEFADLPPEAETSEPVELVALEDLFDDQDVEEVSYEPESEEPRQESSHNTSVAESGGFPERISVTQLFRNDEPGQPQSLLAVVEGYDQRDDAIPFTGEVSLMVLAPGKNKPRRLKRWDFTFDDVSAAWQSSHLGDGLHLELPLEETELPEKSLQLWVRVVDDQGEKLLARESFLRDKLAGLEVETGAKELTPDSPLQIAKEDVPQSEADNNETSREQPVVERLAVKSTNDKKLESSTGWRTSTQRTDMDVQGYDSTVKKTSGWTAQPNGGRYPHLGQGQVKTATNQRPIWTAGRVKKSATKPSSQPVMKGDSPSWSPYR